ncbi:alpha/beta hydrolase [Nocardia sp. NPDC046763]|uniref:alpha/beta fold hydrolase n=1 Tax=Nocardia sp. NPDC046763 TaxID=3155256 RepID=UPI00340AF548
MAPATNASTTSLPTAGGGDLAIPAVRRQRVDGARDGYVERTVMTSDGVRLSVRDYGSAGAGTHTVVLLHGLCLTQESWALQIRQLVRRWGDRVRIITYDHRGHGCSTGAAMRTYRIDRLAADLAEVLTALRVTGPLTLAGHSMGGMTALAYLGRPVLDRPVEPQGLVLIATAAGRLAERGLGRLLATPATRMLFELVSLMPRGATDRASKALVRLVGEALSRYSGHGSAERGAAAVAASAIRGSSLSTAVGFLPGLKRYDHHHTLPSIAAETIVISGGADVTTPTSHARDLVAAIPGATHLHRPAAGHMLLRDEPHCVSAAIDRAMGMRRRPDIRLPMLMRPPCARGCVNEVIDLAGEHNAQNRETA